MLRTALEFQLCLTSPHKGMVRSLGFSWSSELHETNDLQEAFGKNKDLYSWGPSSDLVWDPAFPWLHSLCLPLLIHKTSFLDLCEDNPLELALVPNQRKTGRRSGGAECPVYFLSFNPHHNIERHWYPFYGWETRGHVDTGHQPKVAPLVSGRVKSRKQICLTLRNLKW